MTTAIMWFRHDLRLEDNPAFFEACSNYQTVIPLYILDGKNSTLGEAQSWWLHHSLQALSLSLTKRGFHLILRKGSPLLILSDLVKKHAIEAIYWNRCYTPQAIERDKKIKSTLEDQGIVIYSFNGSVLHEPWTIKNKQGDFFKVFTPYWKTCRKTISPQYWESCRKTASPQDWESCRKIVSPQAQDWKPSRKTVSQQSPKKLQHPTPNAIFSEQLSDWKLLPTLNWASQFSETWTPGENGAHDKLNQFIGLHLSNYKDNRDYPIKEATSHLSPHLHFGEISPHEIIRAVEAAKLEPNCNLASAEHFLSELGWREYSIYMLYHFPKLPHENFNKAFDTFPWQNNNQLLACWQKGMTGYPLVDAGMRELWSTGYMHNRVRMIVASFLTKGLFVDWRLGAEWFLNTLVDADLANNSMGWQWVAGCGVDAAPYFRIFNPVLQSQKFDPQGDYIRRWIPELSSVRGKSIHAPWQDPQADRLYTKTHYPRPIIDHNEARLFALNAYKELKK